MLRVYHNTTRQLCRKGMLNVGTSFKTCSAPLGLPRREPLLEVAVESPGQRPLRIAVAEDECELRHFFNRVLPHLGFDVVAVVATGEELVPLCNECRPEIVITDIQLTGLSGIDAVTAIRQNYWVAAVYVVESPIEDMAAERAANAATLAKPFRMLELSPTIQRAMSLRPAIHDFQNLTNPAEARYDGSS
jgi:CheY-like chemotaxis protein